MDAVNFKVYPKNYMVDWSDRNPDIVPSNSTSYYDKALERSTYYLRNDEVRQKYSQPVSFYYIDKPLSRTMTFESPNANSRIVCKAWAYLMSDLWYYKWSINQIEAHATDLISLPPRTIKVLTLNNQIKKIKWCYLEVDKVFDWQVLQVYSGWQFQPKLYYTSSSIKINLTSLPIKVAIINDKNFYIAESLKLKQLRERESWDWEYFYILKSEWTFVWINEKANIQVKKTQAAKALVNFFNQSGYYNTIKKRMWFSKKYFLDSTERDLDQEVLAYLGWLDKDDVFLWSHVMTKWDLALVFLNIDRETIPQSNKSLRYKRAIEKWYLSSLDDVYESLTWNEFSRMLFVFTYEQSPKKSNKLRLNSTNVKDAIDKHLVDIDDVIEMNYRWVSLSTFLKVLTWIFNLEFDANEAIKPYIRKKFDYVTWTDVKTASSAAKYYALAYLNGWLVTTPWEEIHPFDNLTRKEACELIVRALWKSQDAFDLYSAIKEWKLVQDSPYDVDDTEETNRFIVYLLSKQIVANYVTPNWTQTDLFLWDAIITPEVFMEWMNNLKRAN